MKKLTLMLPVLAVVLASCGGNGSDKTTPTVDPLTLNFTGTGTSTWKPSQNSTLTETFHGTTQNIGTISTDGAVTINITPQMLSAFPLRSISEYKTSMFSSDCNTSQLNISGGGQYYEFIGGFTSSGDKKLVIEPSTKSPNSDGSNTYVTHYYYYVTQAVSITGKVTCNLGERDYNLNFKPGWNHLTKTYTYNSNTNTLSVTKMTTIDQSNTYNGGWLAFNY